MGGADLKDLVLSSIDKLEEIGLTVVLFVCDQGTNDQNLFHTILSVIEDESFYVTSLYLCVISKIYLQLSYI